MLTCNGSIEPRVSRTIHFAHATSAKRRLNFIGTKFRARGESHSCVRLYSYASFSGGFNYSGCMVAYADVEDAAAGQALNFRTRRRSGGTRIGSAVQHTISPVGTLT